MTTDLDANLDSLSPYHPTYLPQGHLELDTFIEVQLNWSQSYQRLD